MGCQFERETNIKSLGKEMDSYSFLKKFFDDKLQTISFETCSLTYKEYKGMNNPLLFDKDYSFSERQLSKDTNNFCYFSKLEEILIKLNFILNIQVNAHLQTQKALKEKSSRNLLIFDKGN